MKMVMTIIDPAVPDVHVYIDDLLVAAGRPMPNSAAATPHMGPRILDQVGREELIDTLVTEACEVHHATVDDLRHGATRWAYGRSEVVDTDRRVPYITRAGEVPLAGRHRVN
jgi:hypothetical protein